MLQRRDIIAFVPFTSADCLLFGLLFSHVDSALMHTILMSLHRNGARISRESFDSGVLGSPAHRDLALQASSLPLHFNLYFKPGF